MRPRTSSKLADGNYPDPQPARANLSSTVDYHRSLLDQHRQQHESTRSSRHTQQCHPSPNHSRGSLRQWLPLSNARKTGSATHNKDTTRKCNKTKNEKDQNSLEASPYPYPHPHLTRKDLEEFEALPIAIRRKYFSTLERLRLAQSSGILDRPKERDELIEHREPRDADNQLCRRHKLRGASLSDVTAGKPLGRPITSPSYRDRDHAHAHAVSVDTAFLAKLPAKIREKHLTREEQVIVAKQLRPSVILDAADEAILKVGRANRRPSPPIYPPTLSSSARPSMESLASNNASAGAHDALYDSFRWLDEDEDLDLRLTLDDYHVNLRETVSLPPKEVRPPSFRRHLSFSKIPFGRTSISSSRPGTKDAAHPMANAPVPNPAVHPQNGRRKSRALSLITPKNTAHESIASIDPAATHYQDPEARLKLRVYLASPQKFDEAIEFGFPSNDASASASPYRDAPSVKGHRRGMPSIDSEKFKTFLADDQSSTCSDDASLPDPESPRTPQTLDKHVKPLQLTGDDYHSSRAPDSYAQAPAASREMTLRMTLTRPDLRAREDQMYGWQKESRQYPGKLSQTWSSRDDTPTSAYAKDGPKESMDKIFADIDQELGIPPSTDGNAVKRFWNRVRRN
ncbi:hypothetical protein F4818DRAFT_431466 [Hypoxylon cercidicola]|nr:hypothetical protein F4818DRAFT_431466 [Hypoxylon cercidicola]